MQGWRKKMEDSHISELNIGESSNHVFGVFDGHGGREVARFVKSHFTSELLKNQNYLSGDLGEALKENFLKMDEILLDPSSKTELENEAKLSKQDEEKISPGGEKGQVDLFKQLFNTKAQDKSSIAMTTGCTACACLIDEKSIYLANAGDSRAILCKSGIAIPLSEDHKPELAGEKARIYKAEGWITDGRIKGNLNLSRSLGDMEYKQNKKLPAKDQMITAYPDLKVVELTDDCEFMVIACDGIWDCKTNQEVASFFSSRFKKNQTGKISSMIEDLLDECLATDISNESGVGCDNMTCVVVQFIH